MKVLVITVSWMRWLGKTKEIMKKIYNYFWVAMAAAAVVSCVKEEITNNTPDTVDGLVFTVQNEAVVKSVLNENITPEWVAGDAISVNGISCALLDAATGTFDGANVETAESYSAVYPYAAENVFTGTVLSATVPAEQVIAKGQNVAAGALVSACISENTTLSFKNCVSLMQIDLPIEGVKEIVITVDGETEVLAGPFTMDLAAETLAPVPSAEGTSKTVTLKPAEGTFAPGTYYAAVLPGTFTGFSVKFIKSEEDTQTIASTKELLLERSNGKTLGTIFTYNIGTAEQLISWAKNNAKYTAWDVVNLTEDIALTAEQAAAYVESNDFCGTFNGNNKKITGLTTPLFGNLHGIVKNLDVTANIVHDGKADTQYRGTDYGLGVLAHYLYKEKNANASISGVTTRGSIKASGVTAAHNYFIGGFAGSSNGVPMTDCTNYASISTENIAISGSNYCCVGGVLGRMQSSSVTFTNCDNYGVIDVQSVTANSPCFGGVFGGADGAYTFTLADCDNMAVNSTSGAPAVSVGNFIWPSNMHMGGVIALTTNKAVLQMTDCDNAAYIKNYAETQNAEKGSKYSHLGGILGVTSGASATLTNCTNSGKVENATINAKGDATYGVRHYVAGVVGRVADGTLTADSCDNSGEIHSNADKGLMMVVGGITGYSDKTSTIKNCENSGKVAASSAGGHLALGGVTGRINVGGTIQNCTNNGLVYNSGPISNTVVMGGVLGYGVAACHLSSCVNNGVVKNESAADATGNGVAIGGFIGRLQGTGPSAVTSCTNASSASLVNIVADGVTLKCIDMGGAIGFCSQNNTEIKNCIVSSTLSTSGTTTDTRLYALIGNVGGSGIKLTGNQVAGTVNGTALTTANFAGLLSNGTVTATDNTLLQ